MIIDGETYACDSCVRGHRARNCKHYTRPLQSISKKGRPVSQCLHCRSLRQSRSAHVKCDCGKRTNGGEGQTSEFGHGKEVCYCYNGGRCICAYKQEQRSAINEAAESGSDEALSGPTPFINDAILGWEENVRQLPDLPTIGGVGRLHEDGTWQSNSFVELCLEHGVHPTSQVPHAGEAVASTRELGGGDCIVSDYQQLSVPEQLVDFANVNYLANRGPGPSAEMPEVAQDKAIADFGFTDWEYNELSNFNSDNTDQLVDGTGYSWDVHPPPVSSAAPSWESAIETGESLNVCAEPQPSATATFDQAFNGSTDEVDVFSEAADRGDHHSRPFQR